MTMAMANFDRTEMTDELVIRPARLDEMEQVAEFVRSSAEWYRPIVSSEDMAEHDVDDDWARTNFRRRKFYIGSVDDEDIGTISLQYFGAYAYLGYIYLDVGYVGNGYGKQLMEFAESEARAAGMRGMALIAHPKATWAKRAYLKYGFEIEASSKSEVLAWGDGVLKPYYEKDFELYLLDFAESATDVESALETCAAR